MGRNFPSKTKKKQNQPFLFCGISQKWIFSCDGNFICQFRLVLSQPATAAPLGGIISIDLLTEWIRIQLLQGRRETACDSQRK